MYTTKPLSLYQRSLDALAEAPPRAPNSGFLVLQDEESTGTTCFGLCKNTLTNDLPFPQNKCLDVMHGSGETSTLYPVFFIPVINQPLSSNRYYAICAGRKHKGEAYASSTEEDRAMLCFCCTYIKDKKSRQLDPNDSYQQFNFSHTTSCGNTFFDVNSVFPDSYPPSFLRRKGWTLWNSEPKHFKLEVAEGVNSSLRSRLPNFNFLSAENHSASIVVGKWYTPFMFIRERTLKEQMKKSMFYEVTLEQKWERIFYCENKSVYEGKIVSFDVNVPTQRVTVNGKEAEEIETDNGFAGMKCFRPFDYPGGESRIGVSLLLIERMKWEQESFGWFNDKIKEVKVSRMEEYEGIGSWEKFGCYLLVESFVFKRMNGSIAVSFDFIHNHQMKIKWE